MHSASRHRRMLVHGAVYGAAAALSLAMARPGGGFAIFWIATALQVSWLLPRHPAQWWPTLGASALANMLATGLFGLGWPAAAPLALANGSEAIVTALAIRWAYRRFGGFTSTPSVAVTCLAGCIAGPAAGLAPALLGSRLALDAPLAGLSFQWMVSHALGFVAVFPLAGMVMLSRVSNVALLPPPGRRLRAACALLAVAAAGALCFGQSQAPALFLPVLVMMYTIVLTDLVVAAAGLAMLLAMGLVSALLGTGPFHLLAADIGERILFLQFYTACLALTAMPLAVLLERRRHLFSALAESETRYRLLADFSTDIIMVTSMRGEIRYISPSVRQLGDWDPELLVGSATDALIAPRHRAEVAKVHHSVARNPGTTGSAEFLGVTRDGGVRWVEAQMRAIQREDGSIDGVCSVVRDISARKRKEAELEAVALTDPLTKLASRRAFELFIGKNPPTGESFIALFSIDDLERVGREFGTEAGDALLQCFGRAARAAVRQNDYAARTGLDEFVLHIQDTTFAQAELISSRLQAAFADEVRQVLPEAGHVRASVGLSRLDGPLAAVLRRAGTALYEARIEGEDDAAVAA